MKEKFTIYKVTNLLNNKIYIGQHVCKCESCSYLGSGKSILRAIKKYGKENFNKEIMFEFDTFEEMNQKEAEIVNEEFVSRKDTYNLMTGGGSSGIPGKETRKKMSLSGKQRLPISEETRKKMSLASSNRNEDTRKRISESQKSRSIESRNSHKLFMNNLPLEYRKKMSNSMKNRYISEEHKNKIKKSNTGLKRSDEARQNIKSSQDELSRKKLGNKNVLKIDPMTNEILDSYKFISECGFNTSNVLIGIRQNKIRYGYIWKLEE